MANKGGSKFMRGAGNNTDNGVNYQTHKTEQKPAKDNGKRELFDQALVALCFIVGLITALLINIYYNTKYDQIPDVLLVATAFAAFAFLLYLAIVIVEIFRKKYISSFGINNAIGFFGGIMTVFILAALFQFIYAFGVHVEKIDFKHYIFVIDDSSSMEGNDPDFERYNALRSLLNGLNEDNVVALYRFATVIDQKVLPSAYNQKQQQEIATILEEPMSSQGTNLQLALDTAINDYVAAYGDSEYTNLVLLSDGQSFIDLDAISNLAIENKVVINSVTLGADSYVMDQLSKLTGGKNYNIDNIDQFREALGKMNSLLFKRDLLGFRAGPSHWSLLYILMRIVFVSVIALVLVLGAILILGKENSEEIKAAMLKSLVTVIMASLILELVNLYNINAALARTIFFALAGLLFLKYKIYKLNFGDAYQGDTVVSGLEKANLQRDKHRSRFK